MAVGVHGHLRRLRHGTRARPLLDGRHDRHHESSATSLVNGVPVALTGSPNQTIAIPGGRLVINEQQTSSVRHHRERPSRHGVGRRRRGRRVCDGRESGSSEDGRTDILSVHEEEMPMFKFAPSFIVAAIAAAGLAITHAPASAQLGAGAL